MFGLLFLVGHIVVESESRLIVLAVLVGSGVFVSKLEVPSFFANPITVLFFTEKYCSCDSKIAGGIWVRDLHTGPGTVVKISE